MEQTPAASRGGLRPGRRERGTRYRHYDMVVAAFVTVLLCSNLIGAGKLCSFALPFGLSLPLIGTTLTFGAGNIFFPFSYIFDDVLTEVYGYARSRKAIWAGFAGLCFASLMAWVILKLPTPPSPPDLDPSIVSNGARQSALEIAFGNTWRIVIASMAAFWAGDFANSYVLAKMKILTKGRYLWTRTIGSTIVGEGLDSAIFYPLAFYGIWRTEDMLKVVAFNWVFKTLVEAVMTPVTYVVVGFLKRSEREDYYDYDTDFTPFSLEG
jgi:uncharacterized integral membrane protein (TIGR00697 family)